MKEEKHSSLSKASAKLTSFELICCIYLPVMHPVVQICVVSQNTCLIQDMRTFLGNEDIYFLTPKQL